MELTLKTSDLVEELSVGQGAVEKKTTIPVLSNVLIEARAGEVVLTATDLEISIQSSCPAAVKENGSTTLPSRRLLDYVRLLPDMELAFRVLENQSASLTCGRSRTRIAGMSAENYPELPEMPAVLTHIPAKVLTNAISKTSFAVADEESRYTLTGALLIIREDSLVMVATDGHRMAYFEKPHKFDGISGEVKGLIPKKALGELSMLAEKLAAQGDESLTIMVDFASDENHLFFRCGKRLLVMRKLTGQFPDYERVLPREAGMSIEIGREEFMAAVRRVAQFADERSRAVRLELEEGQLKLIASGSDAGESEESLPTVYSGDRVQVGFNSVYMLDFLGAVSEARNVEIQFKDEESAGQFRIPGEDSYDYRYVVMPMRV